MLRTSPNFSKTRQPQAAERKGGIYENTTRGIRIYLATPRLRGLLALNLSVAAAGAMVIVNTVVIVRGLLGGTDSDVAIALACFGGGSMAAALMLPRLLDRIADRAIMLPAATALGITLLGFAAVVFVLGWGPSTSKIIWSTLLVTWTLLGVGYSAVMTPSGRLLRRSAQPADRPAVFAAQFALSHACWLLTYPLAGWLGPSIGIVPTLLVLAALTFGGVLLAFRFWPAEDSDVVPHQHPELPPDHPHLHGEPSRHAHAYVIDNLHHRWP
jgi:MFS family permease